MAFAAQSDGAGAGAAGRRRRRPALAGLGRRALALVALVGALALGAGPLLSQPVAPKSITVVMDDNYPPYVFRDEQGQLRGVLVDSWALWERHTGVAVQLRALDWEKAQQEMLAGQADVIDTIFKTEVRAPLYEFTAPYARLDVPIFFHESISGIVNADSLKGFTVGVKAGDACIETLRARGVESLKAYPSYSAVIAGAVAGEVRMFCMDRPPAHYLLQRNRAAGLFRETPPLATGEFHRAVRKGELAMLRLVEDGFARITPAQRERIEANWFGAALPDHELLPLVRYGAYGLLVATLLGGLLLAWNIALRRSVRAKTLALTRSLRDLGEAKRAADQALEHLNATLEAIPDLLFEVDGAGLIIDYRAAHADLLAAPPDQLIGRYVREFMPPAAAEASIGALKEAARSGRSNGVQYQLPLPQGDHWFELSIARKRGRSGGNDRFIVLSRDITERKRIELALQQSEHSFRHFFEAGLVGMAITVPDKHWAQFNRRLAEMLGYSMDELQGLTWAELTHPEDLAADEAHFERLMRSETDHYTMDKRFVRKDGSILHAAIAVRADVGAAGTPERFFAVIEDISERWQAERELGRHRDELELLVQERSHELVAARDEAQAASRAKSELLSRMSHELRTPMNAILGFSQLLQVDASLGSAPKRFVGEILRAGKHLLALINDVLDLAHVESGRVSVSPAPVVLADLVPEVLTLMQPLARERRVILETGDIGGLIVRADHTRLKQVLVNLVSNGIKYNVIGGRVSVDARLHGDGRVRLVVSDTGPGVELKRIPQLFEPFDRLGAEFTSIEGTGIGLSICRRLVEMMGGQLGVESSPGEGSRFQVDLPQATAQDLPLVEQLAPAPVTGAPELSGVMLYVEDNPANLRLMEHLMARHRGVRLYTAASAEQGLLLAQTHRPDLILLDINLPGMDGYAALKALRSEPRTRAIPAIALTANAMRSDVQRALDAGFAEHLAKPLDLAHFDSVLQRHLGRVAA